jgi:hypothetical protein
MVGGLVEGLPITNGQYTGGMFGWFSAFAVLCLTHPLIGGLNVRGNKRIR